MTPELWQRIQELFLAAADLPLADQRDFLEAACAGDPDLLFEVESLLRSDRKQGGGIVDAVGGAAASLLDAQPLDGALLGPWRVLEEIGRGGMGAVYLAERADQHFHKRVAIKVVKRGMDTDEVLTLFHHERHVLARLEHPFIARLIDAGATSDGRPFLVMEYVDGRPIDRYAALHQLSVSDRCRLFLKVCDAVAYAHAHLIVHRDLKPANIFITAERTPKLLDFGVARLLDPSGAGVTLVGGVRPLTPDYASPEQLRGDSVSTATDVYSLGIVFHELLTGSRAEAPRYQDLANIVHKAAHPEAPRRYASVDQFADDIRAYLDCRPVVAHGDSLFYRAGKFVRRWRYSVMAAAAAVLSLLIGIVLALSEARHARAAEAVSAGRLAQMVELSNRSLSDVYAQLERVPGAFAARQALLDTNVDLLRKLSAEAAGDPRVSAALAAAYRKLGNLQGDTDAGNTGDLAGAMKSYAAGSALLAPAVQRQDPEAIALWADMQDRAANILTIRGDRTAALQLLRAAIAIADRAHLDRNRASLRLSLSRALDDTDRPAALVAANESAALAASMPDSPEVRVLHSAARTEVGWIYWNMGDPAAADQPYAEAVRIRERLAADHPRDAYYRRLLRLAYEHYAALQASPERPQSRPSGNRPSLLQESRTARSRGFRRSGQLPGSFRLRLFPAEFGHH